MLCVCLGEMWVSLVVCVPLHLYIWQGMLYVPRYTFRVPRSVMWVPVFCEYLEVCLTLYMVWFLLCVVSMPRSVACVSTVSSSVVCAFAFYGYALRDVSVLHGESFMFCVPLTVWVMGGRLCVCLYPKLLTACCWARRLARSTSPCSTL